MSHSKPVSAAYSRIARVTRTLRDAWNSLDRETAAFGKAAGYACPPQCGDCCTYPEIEVTVLDCLPAMAEFVDRLTPQLGPDQLIDAIADLCNHRSCPFFDRVTRRCKTYETRPTLCRIFGFGARSTRDGKPQLVLCKKLQNIIPDGKPDAVQHLVDGRVAAVKAPNLGDWARRVAAIDPDLGTRAYPVATAFRLAGEYLVHVLCWNESTSNPSAAVDVTL